MANKRVNNVSANTINNTTKEATMNLNNMKKSDLINMIKSQEEIIKALTNENNELKSALVEIKVATKTFVSKMNEVYMVDAVKASTTNITNSTNDVKVEEERKDAPKPEEVDSKPEEHEEDSKPVNKTYREGLDNWKIRKYGSIEIADRVQAMTKVVAAEWREKAKKTGKYVVAKKDYKNKLYEVAYDRVKKEMNEEMKKNADK